MRFEIQRSSQRFFADHGWLKTFHSFSFAEYYDPENVHWGALRVFNDDRVAPGMGFPMHPHRDMEIVTYVFSGELEHQDTMGNRGVVGPGSVQFMSAGTGVRHSEYNARRDVELHLAQMWVVPGQTNTRPLYGQVAFTLDDRRNKWLPVASGDSRNGAPITLTQNATLRVSALEGSSVHLDFPPNRYGFLFLHDGDVQANGEPLGAGDAVRMYDVRALEVEGQGEILFWDLPDA